VCPSGVFSSKTKYVLQTGVFRINLKERSEPLEKKIHENLGSKCEDRFSNPFFELIKIVSGSFFVPASSC